MITKFVYKNKPREIIVLKLDKKFIEGIELSAISESNPDDYKNLLENYAEPTFENLGFVKTLDETDPNFFELSYTAPKNPDLTPYFSHYRKFSYPETSLNFKLRVHKDEICKEPEKDTEKDTEKEEKTLEETTQKLTELSEKSTKTLSELVRLEQEKDKQHTIKFKFIESEKTNEIVLRLESPEGIRYFYVPDKVNDEFGFNQSINTLQNLIAFAYNCGKEGASLNIEEERIQE